MKITPQDAETYETLLATNAALVGCNSLAEFVTRFRDAVAAGEIKPPLKCEATAIFCRLMRGDALRFVCDSLYSYVNDSHIATLHRALLVKHS